MSDQYFNKECGFMDNYVHKTSLDTSQLKKLREDVIRAIDFIEKNKYQISQGDYKNLFSQYQHVLNVYNNMIDRNLVQSKYIDPRTIVQTQPIIDGPSYDVQDWERQFTANNLQIEPYSIPPINAWRNVKDYNQCMGAGAKIRTMKSSADASLGFCNSATPNAGKAYVNQDVYSKYSNAANMSIGSPKTGCTSTRGCK
jgi:hypothetical protein